MFELIAIILAALAVFGVWMAIRSVMEGRDGAARGQDEPPPLPPGYRATWFFNDSGRGWVIERERDGQRLHWRSLPLSDGLDAVNVVGTSDHEDDLQGPALAPGSALTLVREPDNPHSKTGNAIAVYDATSTTQIGYVPSEDAERIAPRLDAGEEVRCYSMWETWEGKRRVALRMLLVYS